MEGLDLFPANGLDKSILTPVLVGVALLTLAAETLGWSYTGLVVPGYLAAIFSTAPITGATVCVESALAYGLARGIGIHLPRVEAWSTFFGRERFFLVIASSMLVRLFSEGVALPTLARYYDFAHASELYSIGLVLIPLVANSAWNIGLWRGVLQNVIAGLFTYAVLQGILIPYTNLSLSRVELSYESVALDFLAAPKAYLVLLAGTLLGARANVRYGWDFHGILVPGLLAVAWYSPSKLLATFCEAVLVAIAARIVVKLPGFRRRLIEGPRRTFLAFCIGFGFKWTLGGTMLQLFPGERATDLYGFGYVLPTLLALKIWQYNSVPRVLMPTLQVSLMGFVAGNLAGLTLAMSWPAPEAAPIARPAVRTEQSLPLQLILQGSLPLNAEPRAIDDDRLDALVAFARAASRGRVGTSVQQCAGEGLEVVAVSDRELGQTWLLRDDRTVRYTPALAVRPEGRGGLVVRGEDPLRMVTASLAVASALDVQWWLILPDRVRVDDGWTEGLTRRLPPGGVRTLDVRTTKIQLTGLVRGDPQRLRRNALTWQVRGSIANLDALGHRELDGWVWGTGDFDEPIPWGKLEQRLAADSYRLDIDGRLRRSELRAFTNHVVKPLREWGDGKVLTPATHGLVHAMGMKLHPVQDLRGSALALHRPAPEHPGQALLWVVRRSAGSLTLSVPINAPSGAVGSFARTLAAAGSARHIVFGNVAGRHLRAPADTTIVRRTYYQRVLEDLLASGQPVISLRKAPPQDAGTQADVVFTSAHGVSNDEPPGYTGTVFDVLDRAGLTHTWYNGDRDTFRYRGSGDPLLDYARRLYSRQVVALWLSDRARERFSTRVPASTLGWLKRIEVTPEPASLTKLLFEPATGLERCDLADAQQAFEQLQRTRHPSYLSRLQDAGERCDVRAVQDLRSGRSFLLFRGQGESIALSLSRAERRMAYDVAGPSAAEDVIDVGATEVRVSQTVAP